MATPEMSRPARREEKDTQSEERHEPMRVSTHAAISVCRRPQASAMRPEIMVPRIAPTVEAVATNPFLPAVTLYIFGWWGKPWKRENYL